MTGPSRGRRLPLRWRVAVAFALAAVLVTGLLALVTWQLASSYMLDQRRQSAAGQFAANARLVTAYLARHPVGDPAQRDALDRALVELEYDQADSVALRAGGRWIMDGPLADPTTFAATAARLLPPSTTGVATPVPGAAGPPATPTPPAPTTAPVAAPMVAEPTPDSPRRWVVHDRPVLATATVLADGETVYVELSSVEDLEQTLRYVGTVLLAGIGASLVVGLGLGRWAGRQALRPLTALTRTAGQVAAGDLGVRLPEHGDADLAALAAGFNRTTAALQQRVARDARFAGDVSHELRSPLTTMVNAAEVLNRRQEELSPTGRQALSLLTTDIERFRRMVVDLLEISREQSGDEREREPCDFAELLRQILTARHETVPLEAPEPGPRVLADRRRLDRAVANLLDNAAQHAGGVVRLAVSRRGNRARLEVDDAGPGIPVELREQVFERFARGDRSGDRGHDVGSGLGLALVMLHVRRHAGLVWVESRPGGGSRFVVELPIHRS